MNSQETINFDITFESLYWDKPPGAIILVDNQEKSNSLITDKLTSISFKHTLGFGQKHSLIIKRFNKTPDQTVIEDGNVIKDQMLVIKQIKIDGVDIHNLIQTICYNEPIYPRLWELKQRSLGIELEKKIKAEVHLGHNSTWTMEFYSPFYQFLMDQLA